ncbi:MAG TPA: glycogen debranching protein GlgX [Ktedonobacteraceae bacterium]|nr:glycogen debranching protein GlgX [Ktedonobacteraceae bacterium]
MSVIERASEHAPPSILKVGMAADGLRIEAGRSHPLGAIIDKDGVNFSIFTDRATYVELLLFANHDDLQPAYIIQLDEIQNKTFHFWHVYVRSGTTGMHYAYRVDGPQDLHGKGDRYDRNKVLIDPYSRGNTDTLWNYADASGPGDNLTTSMRSVVIDLEDYDWGDDRPLNRPMNETIIYEMHVRGFTRSSSSGCRNPGTFSGIIEKIPYLKELGVTAIELLPVFDFDEKSVMRLNPLTGAPLTDYWGYNPISFFCPQSTYCVTPECGDHVREFRDMVKALHREGIEVILDVVFNHTGEGDERGPTINFKGLANSSYYLLSQQDRQYYMNYSGCGNTVYANHPITQKLILEALEFWVKEMHVDGFRFDEAVILCRDENGVPMLYPPVIWSIELSEALADTKIIAEAWDAAGLYEVGYFPGYRWAEWNGRYRDTIRQFVRGDKGYIDGKTVVGRVADVIAGSADIFQSSGELPINSINFVTAHDGFTLNDLVSYNSKHNEANGEANRDGIDNNLSWNCGIEGETDNAGIEALRERQIKNFATILMIAQGVPMFVAGDEVRRTQKGNNNPYCQDNELSWFDWTLVNKNHDLLRFFRGIIALRKHHRNLQRNHFFTGQMNSRNLLDISWHGCRLNSPGWFDPDSHVLAFTLGGFAEEKDGPEGADIHVMLNMDAQDLDFDIPPLAGRRWYRVVDTALPSPQGVADDVVEPGVEAVITGSTYHVTNHSAVVLVSR